MNRTAPDLGELGAIGSIKRFEPALALHSALVNAADAVVITELVGMPAAPRIVYVNPAFTRMTGYQACDVVGKTPQLLQGARTCPQSRAKIRDAIAHGESVTVELINYRKDHSEYHVEISLAPMVDEGRASTLWVGIARDISLRRLGPIHSPRSGVDAGIIARLNHTQELERARARLEHKASHDDLTGLYNRNHFMQCLDSALDRALAEPEYAFSVIYLDINRFKLVNDHLGHRTGDRILRDFARRFENYAGSRDTLARVGGDEFGLIIDMPDTSDQAVSVAGRLLMEIAQRPRFRVDDVVLSASIGIVHSTPGMIDAELVMRDADVALSKSQQAGGSAWVVFTPEMHAHTETAQRMRNDLYGAVERAEMRLYYQPLVDIAIGRIYGFEALVRWQHPVRGLIAPDDFIPIAEETGLIVELGRWVLLEGCRKAHDLQQLAGEPLLMSLNVSSQQLFHPDFPDHLQTALDASGMDPKTLQIEITESIFLAGGAVAGTLLARIRALGIRIALDDFGTGYSSLSYLERFQIDTLKIDKSFVSRIHDASGKSEILRMIIALAHSLGVDVIAEGVETRAQRDALGRLGCTHLQGYLFSRPVSEHDAAALLRADSESRLGLATLLQETLTGADATALSDEQRRELQEQVDVAIATHHVWIERLHRAAQTGEAPFDLEQVAREDLCPIGVWLNATICETLRTMPLYFVTKSRHAVFHRSMARLLAAAAARRPEAALSLRPDGDFSSVAASLLRTLHDWRAVAAAGALRQ